MPNAKNQYRYHANTIPFNEFKAIEDEVGMKRASDHAKTRDELLKQRAIAQSAMRLCEVNPDKTQEAVWNYYREIIEAIEYRLQEEI